MTGAADVSVVIPVYNRAHVVARAVRSVQAQSVPVREIILVDDGSSDDSLAVIRALAGEDERIVVLSQQNGGAAAARNTGMARAGGEWIAFLDSDDEWLPGKLAAMQSHLADSEVGFVFSSNLYDKHGEPVDGPLLKPEEGCDKLWITGKFLIKTSAVLFRRGLLQDTGMFCETLQTCEDYEFFWRLIAVSPRIAYIPERLNTIHLGPDGLTQSNSEERLRRDDIRAMDRACGWLAGRAGTGGLIRALKDVQYNSFVQVLNWRLSERDWRAVLSDMAWCRRSLGLPTALYALASAMRG